MLIQNIKQSTGRKPKQPGHAVCQVNHLRSGRAGGGAQAGGGYTSKYYNAGGQRIALRQDGELTWLFGDPLGSGTVTA